MSAPFDPLAFDREVSLAEMLRHVPERSLADGLGAFFGEDWAIVDEAGAVLAGPAAAALPLAASLHHEGERIGRLTAARNEAALPGAARLVQALLLCANRYRMAVSVHEAAIAEDYAALQRKHAALLDSEGRYRALAGALEERVAEQVTLIQDGQRKLYQAEKMASVGQLAAGMAHEINNPIGFITSNLRTARGYVASLAAAVGAWKAGEAARAQALWQQADGDFLLEDFRSLLEESARGAERVAAIVADLKAFSSIDQGEETEVDVQECLRSTVKMAAPMAAGRVAFELDLAPVPKVPGHAGHLNQVFMSLVQNALLATEGTGTVRLATAYECNEVRVSVEDHGCGMSAETLARAFDPFFTTRDVGKGMGLGLTVSRDIVGAHGGRIEARSAPGKGSTFTVCLPARRTAA